MIYKVLAGSRSLFQGRPYFKFSIHNYMKTIPAEQVTRHHGRVRSDQNATHFSEPSKLQQFVTKQSQLYTKQSQKWQPRTKAYLQIVNSRRDQRTQSTAQIYNNHEYFTTAAWHEGRQYTQIWRREIGKARQPQLVLDIMKYPLIRNYYKTVELIRTVFSQCGNYIAFGVDLHNNEQISFMIKNIGKNHIVGVKDWQENRIKGVDNMVFSGDSGIYYTKSINFRPAELWYQNFKTGEAQLVYSQKNGQYYLDIQLSKDNKHLIVNSNSKSNSKIYTIDIAAGPVPKHEMKQLLTSKADTKTYVNFIDSHIVIWKDSKDGSQIILKNASTQKQTGIHRLEPSSAETITDIDIFQKYIVLYIRKVVSPVIRIIQIDSKEPDKSPTYEVPLPYEFGSVHPGANQMFKSKTFMFYVNNIFVYNEGYEYNFDTKKVTIKEPFKMTGPKFNPKDYIVSLHEVPAEDGELVPLTTIVPKRHNKRRNKMLLHVYGYYGLAYEIAFNNTYWAALENGWSLAYAHVRGGGEKGTRWHKQAIKGQRYKNWTDLQDCVAHLLKNNFTHPNILILSSHSAGSITIWNTINRYPHLYKAVVMSYPFLQVLGSLLDSSKPLTQSDYPEFGNPTQNLQTYNEIESYCPYENIQENKKYPFVYIVGGTKDYRCPVQQIAKFTKRFRELRKFQQQKQRFRNIGENGLLVKINQASHEGIADLGEQAKDGCQMLACMDYLIEQASQDVAVK